MMQQWSDCRIGSAGGSRCADVWTRNRILRCQFSPSLAIDCFSSYVMTGLLAQRLGSYADGNSTPRSDGKRKSALDCVRQSGLYSRHGNDHERRHARSRRYEEFRGCTPGFPFFSFPCADCFASQALDECFRVCGQIHAVSKAALVEGAEARELVGELLI